MRFFKQTNFNFLGKRRICLILSTLLVLVAIGALVKNKGPVLGIDFTGGTFLQIGFKDLPPLEEVRDALRGTGFEGFTLQPGLKASSLPMTSQGRSAA